MACKRPLICKLIVIWRNTNEQKIQDAHYQRYTLGP